MRVLVTSILLAILLLVLVASIALAGWSEPVGHRWLA
jgi:hypothetical protein